jgi:cold shock CspA family protein
MRVFGTTIRKDQKSKERRTMIGIVNFYDRIKGFGFAIPADESGQPDDTQDDIFVHVKHCQNKKHLKRGDLILYEVGIFKGRPVAINVTVLAPAAPATNGSAK